jgi:autotransporter-associated beta strand protein
MLLPLLSRFRRQPARATPAFRPRLDCLEDRVLPATSVWNGAGDGHWSNGGNWVGGLAPAPGDDLLFPAGAYQFRANNDFPAGTPFDSLTFSGGGYNLTGNAIQLTAGIRSTVPTGANGPNNTLGLPVQLAADQTITTAFAGVALILNGPLATNGFTLTVAGAGTTSLGGAISGAGGIIKTGAGLMELRSNASSYTGPTVLDAGITTIWNNASLGNSATGTIVNPGAMLTTGAPTILYMTVPLTLYGTGVGGLSGGDPGAFMVGTSTFITWAGPVTLGSDATIGCRFTGQGTFSTNPIDLNGHTLTVNGSGTLTFASPIVDSSGGSGNVVIENSAPFGTVWNLTAANTWTGNTTIAAGIVNLSGNGSLASTSVGIERGGTLQLDNSTTDNTDRIPDTAEITLDHGGLSFVGNNADGAASTETVGTITLAAGHSTLSARAGTGAGATATLLAANLVRNPGATFNATGANLGTASNRILFSTPPTTVGNNGGILPYGSVNDVDFATYDASTGLKAFTGYVTSLAAAGPGDTVKLQDASETVPADKTVNALMISTSTLGVGTVSLDQGTTLTLASGGLFLLSPHANSYPVIHPTNSSGTATVNFGDSEGVVFGNTGGFSSFLDTVLAGTNGVTFTGASGQVSVQPPSPGNTYTGGTYLDTNKVFIPSGTANPFGPPDSPVTISNASLLDLSTTLPNPIVFHNANSNLQVVTLTGPVSLQGTVDTLSGNITFTGQVSGTAPLLLYQASVILQPQAGANTFSGGTILRGSNLYLTNATPALGNGPLTFADLPFFSSNAFGTNVTGGVSISNPVVFSSSNNNVSFGETGSFATYTQPLTLAGPVVLGASSTLIIDVPVTVTGDVTGVGTLTQGGANTLTFRGNSSLDGSVAANGTVLVNGSLSVPVTSVGGGVLGGTGSVGLLGSVNVVIPGSPTSTRGILSAGEANLSNGGSLRIKIHGYDTAGVDFDRLDLSGGLLTLGGTAQLTLDLAGLTTTGTAAGVLLYGGLTGVVPRFARVTLLNNPDNYLVGLDYSDNALDVTISSPTAMPRIITDGGAGFSATSGFLLDTSGGYQNHFRYALPGDGSQTATWTFSGLTPGLYRVSATWTSNPNRATNAPFTVRDGSTTLASVPIDQQLLPASFVTPDGTYWQDLAGPPFAISSDTLTVQLSNSADGRVVANAIRIERVGDLPGPVEIVGNQDPGFSATSGFSVVSGQGYEGQVYEAPAGSGSETATWSFAGLAVGVYRVSITWPADPGAATIAPFSVLDGGTSLATQAVNQQQAPRISSTRGSAGASWAISRSAAVR